MWAGSRQILSEVEEMRVRVPALSTTETSSRCVPYCVEQRPWEDQKVLKCLLKVLDGEYLHRFYSEYIEILERHNEVDAYSFSRMQQ
jgi:hypothetical protein